MSTEKEKSVSDSKKDAATHVSPDRLPSGGSKPSTAAAPILPTAFRENVSMAAAGIDPKFHTIPTEAAARPVHHSNMPDVLLRQIAMLREWAWDNQREARRELMWFWLLKVPVIIVSAGYGAMLHFGLETWIAASGAIASACALIDGLYRPGHLRGFHHKAYFELVSLADELETKWQIAFLKSEGTDSYASALLTEAQTRKKKINDYLSDAESAMGRKKGVKA